MNLRLLRNVTFFAGGKSVPRSTTLQGRTRTHPAHTQGAHTRSRGTHHLHSLALTTSGVLAIKYYGEKWEEFADLYVYLPLCRIRPLPPRVSLLLVLQEGRRTPTVNKEGCICERGTVTLTNLGLFRELHLSVVS